MFPVTCWWVSGKVTDWIKTESDLQWKRHPCIQSNNYWPPNRIIRGCRVSLSIPCRTAPVCVWRKQIYESIIEIWCQSKNQCAHIDWFMNSELMMYVISLLTQFFYRTSIYPSSSHHNIINQILVLFQPFISFVKIMKKDLQAQYFWRASSVFGTSDKINHFTNHKAMFW